MAWKEHPEICPGCARWQDVVDHHIVEHESPRAPKNAHERRHWKKHGRPKCKGSGEPIFMPPLMIEVPD